VKKIKYTALVMATVQKSVTVEVDAEADYEDYDPDVEAEEAAMRAYIEEHGEPTEIEVIALVEEEFLGAHRPQAEEAIEKLATKIAKED
jgi:hypothetical protein